MTWCLAMAYYFWFLRILQFWVQSCLCIFVIPIEMVRVFSSIRQVGWHVLKCSRKVAFFFCISQMFIEAKTDTSSLALSDVRGPMCACIACDHRYDILQWHFSFRSDIQQLHYLLPARHCFFSSADFVSFSERVRPLCHAMRICSVWTRSPWNRFS